MAKPAPQPQVARVIAQPQTAPAIVRPAPRTVEQPQAGRAIAEAALEVTARGAKVVTAAAGVVGHAARPVLRLAWRPPVLPERMWPQTRVERLAHAGRARRQQADGQVAIVLDGAVPAIADAIIARLDIDAIVNRLDLAAIANNVIDEIDLPAIIRESSGSMASEAMLDVRMRGIEADEIVNRIVDRILRRHNGRRPKAAGEAAPAAQSDGRRG